jgi:hypothetical protein
MWYKSRFDSSESMEWIEKKLNWPQSWYTHLVIGPLVTQHDTIF